MGQEQHGVGGRRGRRDSRRFLWLQRWEPRGPDSLNNLASPVQQNSDLNPGLLASRLCFYLPSEGTNGSKAQLRNVTAGLDSRSTQLQLLASSFSTLPEVLPLGSPPLNGLCGQESQYVQEHHVLTLCTQIRALILVTEQHSHG